MKQHFWKTFIFKSFFPPLRDAGGRGSWTEDVVLKFVLKSAEAVLAEGDTGDKGDMGEWPWGTRDSISS